MSILSAAFCSSPPTPISSGLEYIHNIVGTVADILFCDVVLGLEVMHNRGTKWKKVDPWASGLPVRSRAIITVKEEQSQAFVKATRQNFLLLCSWRRERLQYKLSSTLIQAEMLGDFRGEWWIRKNQVGSRASGVWKITKVSEAAF